MRAGGADAAVDLDGADPARAMRREIGMPAQMRDVAAGAAARPAGWCRRRSNGTSLAVEHEGGRRPVRRRVRSCGGLSRWAPAVVAAGHASRDATVRHRGRTPARSAATAAAARRPGGNLAMRVAQRVAGGRAEAAVGGARASACRARTARRRRARAACPRRELVHAPHHQLGADPARRAEAAALVREEVREIARHLEHVARCGRRP